MSVSTTSSLNSCNAGNSVASEVFYDGLGRKTSSQVQGPNGPITTTTTYDAMGRGYQASNPYESGSPALTTTTYDVLNRVLNVTTPDNAVTHSAYSSSGSYDQTLVTDPAGNQRTTYNDGLGRLAQVLAQGPSSVSGQNYTTADYTTNYTYDVLDNLTNVTTSQSSRNRIFAYDGLSRLTSATNPENGTVQYTLYDGNGNLKTKIANGITTTYTYDALNRLTNKSYSDGVTAPVTYTYDKNEPGSSSPNYYIGRLSQVSTAALGSLPATATTYVQYDAMGRVLASQQSIGTNQTYNFSYTYNAQSLENEVYPSLRTVQSCYDSAGRVSKVQGVGTGAPTYANLTYTLNSGTSKTTNTMGNSLSETDMTNTRLQMSAIQVVSIMSLGFNYGTTNNNGNVLSQTITRGSQSWVQSYAYDSLNRIACANENPSTAVACAASAGNWWRTFGYDPWANGFVTSNSNSTLGLNSFTPTVPTNFNGSNQMTYQGATYDGAGNQTAIGGYGFTYDAENRMTASKLSGATASYVYDGDGRRVTKTMGGATTSYVYDAMGQLVAEYGTPTDSGTKYVSVDHLGSTRLVTDSSGNPERCYDFLPFGEEILSGTDGRSATCFTSPATPLTQKFTGKEREGTESDLSDYFGARYFSALQGRFTSPDRGNVGTNIRNPQTWNAYAYVNNSPLASIDPNGLATCTLEGFETPCNDIALLHEAVVECPNDVCAGWASAGSSKIAYYRFGAYADGTSGYYRAAPAVADPSAQENQVYRAFLLAAQYATTTLDPNQWTAVVVRYVGSTYNVQLPTNDLNVDQASEDGFKDPITMVHAGNQSYYLGFWNLGTVDAGHVVQDPTGVQAHYDNFGPADPLHWIFEWIPSLMFNTQRQADATNSNTRTTWVCSINLGCL